MSATSRWQLVIVPALITLGVTVFRLLGELQGWSSVLFRRDAGGVGSIVGIIWLAPIFGVYFALRLSAMGAGPSTVGRAVSHALLGTALFLASGGVLLWIWPPYQVQVIATSCVALAVVALQLRGWPALGKILLKYAAVARVPVVIIMFFSIFGRWGTHYDAFPTGFPLTRPFERWLWGGLLVQMIVWVGNTVVLGALSGSVAAAILQRRRRSRSHVV